MDLKLPVQKRNTFIISTFFLYTLLLYSKLDQTPVHATATQNIFTPFVTHNIRDMRAMTLVFFYLSVVFNHWVAPQLNKPVITSADDIHACLDDAVDVSPPAPALENLTDGPTKRARPSVPTGIFHAATARYLLPFRGPIQ